MNRDFLPEHAVAKICKTLQIFKLYNMSKTLSHISLHTCHDTNCLMGLSLRLLSEMGDKFVCKILGMRDRNIREIIIISETLNVKYIN